MKWLVFLGSVLGTVGAACVACSLIVATLGWIVLRWCPAPWVLWAIGLGLAAAVGVAIWRWWRLPAERRFRFSVRGMLIGVTLVALWIGLIGVELLRSGRQAVVVRELAGRGAVVQYYGWDDRRELVGRIFRCDPHFKVRWICITRNQGLSALLEHADDLPDLDCVTFEGANVTDASLAHAEELNRFPKLSQCLFNSCQVTGAGLERLAALRTLEAVSLYDCGKVTDSGVAHIAQLTQLRELRLADIPISDAGMVQLRNMPNLSRLILRQTEVTEEGILALCEGLPDCLVTWEKAWFPVVSQIQEIEIWTRESPQQQLATITDRERIKTIKEWLDQYNERFYGTGGHFQHLRDTSLSVRFEGRRRRLCEIGLGNGMYLSYWGNRHQMPSADDEEIRGLLGVDGADWNTGEVD